MLTGPSIELYREILEELPDVEIIASGGIASMDDILKLDEMGVPGVITGKAIYENKITLTNRAIKEKIVSKTVMSGNLESSYEILRINKKKIKKKAKKNIFKSLKKLLKKK